MFCPQKIKLSCEIQKKTHKMKNTNNRVGHLERFADHTSTGLTGVAEGRLIVGCLTSSGKYIMHIQDENKSNNYQELPKMGLG